MVRFGMITNESIYPNHFKNHHYLKMNGTYIFN